MTLKSCLSKAAYHVGPILFAFAGLLFIKEFDQSKPVVTDFSVTKQYKTTTGVMIEGSMNKVRDCDFVEVVAYAGSRIVPVKFYEHKKEEGPYTRAVRFQLWGPWEVLSGETKRVTLVARHQCHIFWKQSTKLVKFEVGDTDESK